MAPHTLHTVGQNHLLDVHIALRELALKPVFAVTLELASPTDIGATPTGQRRLVSVLGGVFSGPEGFIGRVLPGGNDVVTVRSDSAIILDARIVLQAASGETVLMTYGGLRVTNDVVARRLAEGRVVDPSEYYFRIYATFDTSSPTLSWMNCILAIGAGHRQANAVTYGIFQVL